MASDSWDAPIFNCIVCWQLYSDVQGDSAAPVVVCDNLHTMCAACFAAQSESGGRCPQCRCALWETAQRNRDLIFFVSHARLRCGGCADETLMSVSDAHAHRARCAHAFVQCPAPLLCGAACAKRLRVVDVWEHLCAEHTRQGRLELHNSVVTASVDPTCTETLCASGVGSNGAGRRVCVHVTAGDSVVMLSVRVFDAAAAGMLATFSAECGESSGFVVSDVPVLDAAEAVSAEGPHTVALPLALLRQMGAHASLVLTVQLSERAPAGTSAETT